MTGFPRAPLAEVLDLLPTGRLIQQGWSPQCHAKARGNESEWAVLTTTAIQEGRYQPAEHKLLPSALAPRPELEVQPSDLLLTSAGPRRRCAIPCLVRATPKRLLLSGKMYRFRALPSRILPEFLEQYLLSPDAQKSLEQMKTGISDSGLNLTHERFLALSIPCPSLDEQRRIVDALEDHLSRLDAAEEGIRASIRRTDSLRRALIASAFSCELPGAPRHVGRNVTLAEISHVTFGQSPPGASYNQDGVGTPFLQGKKEFADLYPEIRAYTTAPSKYASQGDILLSVRAPVGPTNLAPIDCAIGRGLAAIRARDGVDQRYLLWALRASEPELASRGAGSTFPAITGNQLREHRLTIAPPELQRQVVDILEGHLSRLNPGRDALEATLGHGAGLRRALLAAAFSGRLTGGSISSKEPKSSIEGASA